MPQRVVNNTVTKSVTIAESGTTTPAFSLEGAKLAALQFGTMTGTTMTFLASNSKTGTFNALYDDAGNAISITVTDDAVVGITSSAASMALAGVQWLKLVSGSSEAAERTINVLLKS